MAAKCLSDWGMRPARPRTIRRRSSRPRWDQGNGQHTAPAAQQCRCILRHGREFRAGNMYHEEIAQLTAKIVEAERPEKIILFGSYASGTATESSDIDLLVISRSELPRREREVRLTRQLFGSGVPFDLFVLTPEEVEERLRRNGPFIREILSTGQVVYQRP